MKNKTIKKSKKKKFFSKGYFMSELKEIRETIAAYLVEIEKMDNDLEKIKDEKVYMKYLHTELEHAKTLKKLKQDNEMEKKTLNDRLTKLGEIYAKKKNQYDKLFASYENNEKILKLRQEFKNLRN